MSKVINKSVEKPQCARRSQILKKFGSTSSDFVQTSSCLRERRCFLSQFSRRHMGHNRKWLLQDDIQEAVWRTILRGPRPPSNKWEIRNKSDASKPHSKVVKGEPKKGSTSAQEAAGSGQSTVRSEGAETPRANQAMEAARARVVKLQGVLTTWARMTRCTPQFWKL